MKATISRLDQCDNPDSTGGLDVVPRDVGDTPGGRIDRLREGLLVRCEATKQTRPHQGDPRGPP